MILKWFDASEAKKFGASLADFYMERTSVEAINRSSKFVAKKQNELLEKIRQQIMRFKLENKLNVYKKAQIGNAFKWRLKEANYDAAYVDQLTSWLMVQI